MSTTKETKHSYDVVVIGAGLSGLAVASQLSRMSKVLLVEATESFGGTNHAITTSWGVRTNGLRFLPATAETKQALQYLATALKHPELRISTVEAPPVTEDGKSEQQGGLTSFIGFGDATPEHYEALSYFLAQERIDCSLELTTWTTLLKEAFTGDFWPMSPVSKIEFEDNHAVGVWVNAQKYVKAKKIVFAAPLPLFPQLVTGQPFHQKVKSEFARSKFATAIHLDLFHAKHQCATEQIHCLGYLSGSEPLPTVGRFHDVAGEAEGVAQYSQWLSFINDEAAEDLDLIGQALHKMKRAIKRLYPEGIEGPLRERIGVAPGAHFTGQFKSKDGMQSTHMKGVYFANGEIHAPKNVVGSLLQAEKVTMALMEEMSSGAQRTPDHAPSEDQTAHSHTETDAAPV